MKRLPICGGPSLAEVRCALWHLLAHRDGEQPWSLSFRVDDPLAEVEVSPTDIQIGDFSEIYVAGKIFGDAQLMDVKIAYNPEGPDGLMIIREDDDDLALPSGPIFVREGEDSIGVAENYRYKGGRTASGRG